MTLCEAWAVAVFAHNEERSILACLKTVPVPTGGHAIDVFVLANGCTDRTVKVVEEYAKKHPGLHVLSLTVGDKANAWNVYIHDVAPTRELHFFVDGDVRVCEGAFGEMQRALRKYPRANAAAGYPAGGRTMRKVMLQEGGFAGNLYALRGEFVERIRRTGVRLPVGFVREDGLVSALALWDLEPREEWKDGLVVQCPEARFSFDSLSYVRPRDWRIYWRRRIRYAVGGYQFQMLRPLLKRHGVAGMPKKIEDLYGAGLGTLGPTAGGLEPLFRAIARRRIKGEWRQRMAPVQEARMEHP